MRQSGFKMMVDHEALPIAQTRPRSSISKHLPSRLNLFLFILNILFAIILYRYEISLQPSRLYDQYARPQLTYSPAREYTTYEVRRLYRSLDDNPYVGPPTDEYDAAWAKIVEPMVIRLTAREYALANLADATLSLADGSGERLAEMAVYHELHCIKRLRRHLYPDRYYGAGFANLTASEREREQFHVEHCLEYWREAAVCRADPTLTTMFWRDGLPTSRSYDDHECVNWQAFDGWARSRMFDVTRLDDIDQDGRWDLVSNEKGASLSAHGGH